MRKRQSVVASEAKQSICIYCIYRLLCHFVPRNDGILGQAGRGELKGDYPLAKTAFSQRRYSQRRYSRKDGILGQAGMVELKGGLSNSMFDAFVGQSSGSRLHEDGFYHLRKYPTPWFLKSSIPGTRLYEIACSGSNKLRFSHKTLIDSRWRPTRSSIGIPSSGNSTSSLFNK